MLGVIEPALKVDKKYGSATAVHKASNAGLGVIARKFEKTRREEEVSYGLLISPPFAVFSLSPTTKQA